MPKQLVAFDLDGTLALSKQPLDDDMAARLAGLLGVAHVAIISGGDWPQFEKQVIARMPADAKLEHFHILPTTGTKLYNFENGAWKAIYAELFSDDEKHKIINALDEAMKAEGFDQGQTWGERIEDRGSQITFSALGQQAPLEAKEHWDPDHAKRKKLQARLRPELPGLSINSGGATSIDVTREGVDKAYGLKKLSDATGIALDAMIFIGDAIFPGGNDYPAKTLGLDCIQVKTVDDTRFAVEGITLALK
jgi:phosphomannomutase